MELWDLNSFFCVLLHWNKNEDNTVQSVMPKLINGLLTTFHLSVVFPWWVFIRRLLHIVHPCWLPFSKSIVLADIVQKKDYLEKISESTHSKVKQYMCNMCFGLGLNPAPCVPGASFLPQQLWWFIIEPCWKKKCTSRSVHFFALLNNIFSQTFF